MKIAVIGAGAWGTAIAVYLAKLGHELTLVTRDPEEAEKLRYTQESLHLPGISINGIAIASPNDAPNCDIVMVAVPSHAILDALDGYNGKAPVWLSLAKGIRTQALTTPCETIESVLPEDVSVGCFSGPSHARSVAEGLPCTMVISGNDSQRFARIQQEFASTQLRVYLSADRKGAELGGALKNTFAVAAGVCDALRVGDNAKAGLLTRAIAEMARIGVVLGGQLETFYGLTGIGDLIATSYGQWSRNRQLGERVSRGESAAELIAGGFTAEGYRTCVALQNLAKAKKISAPIVDEVVAILHQNRAPTESISNLMNRPLKAE